MDELYYKLRDSGESPRWHGNGFIQLPLPAGHRLHVWHPDFPMDEQNNAFIHTHVWDMSSTILLGTLIDTTYRGDTMFVGDLGLMDIYSVGEAGKPGMGPRIAAGIGMVEVAAHRMVSGSVYSITRNHFHKSVANGLTATMMWKGPTRSSTDRPFVVCPADQQPYDAFSRTLDAHDMWAAIREALTQMNADALNIVGGLFVGRK
jgi:hypothetical protein